MNNLHKFPVAHQPPGPCLNIKTVFPGIGIHYKDETAVRPSYIHNWNPYTGKMASLYRNSSQVISRQNVDSVNHYIFKCIPLAEIIWSFDTTSSGVASKKLMEFAGTMIRVIEDIIEYRMRPVLMVPVLGHVYQHASAAAMMMSQPGASVLSNIRY